MDKPPKPHKSFVAAIDRGMRVLLAFDGETVKMTPAEVAAKTGLSRATARRMLLTLKTLGYLAADGKAFRLTPKVLDLGRGYLASMQTAETFQPFIDEAAEKVNETCLICVLDGAEIVTIACSRINPPDGLHIDVGSRFPAHYTAIGRCILAAMPEAELDEYIASLEFAPPTPDAIKTAAELKEEVEKAREQDYAVVESELLLGIFTIAVPVRNGAGEVFAGANFGGNVARVNRDNMRSKFLPLLQDLSARLQNVLPRGSFPLQ